MQWRRDAKTKCTGGLSIWSVRWLLGGLSRRIPWIYLSRNQPFSSSIWPYVCQSLSPLVFWTCTRYLKCWRSHLHPNMWRLRWCNRSHKARDILVVRVRRIAQVLSLWEEELDGKLQALEVLGFSLTCAAFLLILLYTSFLNFWVPDGNSLRLIWK